MCKISVCEVANCFIPFLSVFRSELDTVPKRNDNALPTRGIIARFGLFFGRVCFVVCFVVCFGRVRFAVRLAVSGYFLLRS